ncbi:MAG: beta-3-deoxy-D-manno-oct-2-ulosonic acid transferase [Nitrospira sp.]|nr:beta-3-deoxy-D-manno-oct-2-ulosonic acid transferase [Nitrospira sp.]
MPPVVYALNFSAWKRTFVRQCFPHRPVIFVSRISQVPEHGCLAVWGVADSSVRMRRDVCLLILEDGFLRSVGLGADLIRPLSWVVDTQGIYYDATRPSDLETLLEAGSFDIGTLNRARALRERIVAGQLTKYNVGHRTWQPPSTARRVILVLGQVESDASLACGAPEIRRNIDLLHAVRTTYPNAYVIYKPHPDVTARLRAIGIGEHLASLWCDEVVVDVTLDRLLDSVDAVHVMTSLAGFEALLRGKNVTCYGQPFYAGWGLTSDVVPHPRRTRRLTLDELVAGALIDYPLYFSRARFLRQTPEEAVDELLAWRAERGGATPWWRKSLRVVLRKVVGTR